MLHADETRARQVLELLLSRGANPWISGNSGTCLNVLSNKKLAPILQKLIETHSSIARPIRCLCLAVRCVSDFRSLSFFRRPVSLLTSADCIVPEVPPPGSPNAAIATSAQAKEIRAQLSLAGSSRIFSTPLSSSVLSLEG
jgi:hypothetical protein